MTSKKSKQVLFIQEWINIKVSSFVSFLQVSNMFEANSMTRVFLVIFTPASIVLRFTGAHTMRQATTVKQYKTLIKVLNQQVNMSKTTFIKGVEVGTLVFTIFNNPWEGGCKVKGMSKTEHQNWLGYSTFRRFCLSLFVFG